MKFEVQCKASRGVHRLALALLAAFAAMHSAPAQETPLISGSLAFLQGTTEGETSYLPAFMPVGVVPVKQQLVFETRALFAESITPRTDKSYKTRLAKNVNYLQADYLANAHLTLVAGKFLTPFATYNERLSPIWIGNFQDAPLIVTLGINGAAGVGGEARGSLFANNAVAVDYAAFFQANVNNSQFTSSRATGGRINFYFPPSGFELGASYDHMFEGLHPDTSGVHMWWEPHNMPLTVRSEFAHDTNSEGYWIETGSRLARINGENSWIGRLEPLFRMQQTFRIHPDSTDGLPAVNTQRADFGLDYYLPHEIRIITSYTRQFSASGNGNIWKTELVYRFLTPAWPGRKQ
jgi:hypothetical protein